MREALQRSQAAYSQLQQEAAGLQADGQRALRRAGVLEQNLEEGLRSLAELEPHLRALAKTKPYRIAHLLRRLERDFAKGSLHEKQAFWNWFRKRLVGRQTPPGVAKNPLLNTGLSAAARASEIRAAADAAISANQIGAAQPVGEPWRAYGLKEIVSELRARVHAGKIRGIAIVPSAFEFDELYNQRTINLSKYLAEAGLGVVYLAWQWHRDEVLRKAYQVVYSNVWEIPLYAFLEGLEHFSPLADVPEKHFVLAFPAGLFSEATRTLRGQGFSILYDIMDDWEEFGKHGEAGWYEREVEEASLLSADVVTAVSPALVTKFQHLRRDIVCIGNGYDPALLGPRDIAQRQAPAKLRIGYFGHLTDSWFDWDLVFQVADAHADLELHIIGYGVSEATEQRVRTRSNVICHGKVPPRELRHHVVGWHLGMIPFRQSALARAVDPIKVYEYLYFGLPVVCSGINHVASYPWVRVCPDATTFAVAARELTAAAISGTLDQDARDAFLFRTTWQQRFDQMLALARRGSTWHQLYQPEPGG